MAFLISACAVPEQRGGPDPLQFDATAMEGANSAVVAIPGALTSIRVLFPLDAVASRNRAVAYYRLPGYDGRPEEEWVDIDRAAQRIARLVQENGLVRIDLVGHSTGAVIAIEAAKVIRQTSPNTKVHLHAISTALPAPQPVLAGVRGAAGTVAAAARAGSLKPRVVWLEYYRRLAYGPGAETDPQVAQAADALVAANDDRITLPSRGLGRRHTRALRQWRNKNPERLSGAQLDFYHGAVDPVFPPRITARFVDTLPGAKLHLIAKNGHLLLLTYPQVWDRIIAEIRSP
ncbi:alpha/beta hydrolase [uncultured Tateyamaria sp.]|uniref:alpha/beta fold hydrolase n=1 Tax=uncultured Tateyamaria sp. TaxID=455651 RepID=UPI00261672FB|nr:alpha/beta hydrolase [uncultured Tateyamaria sp.]